MGNIQFIICPHCGKKVVLKQEMIQTIYKKHGRRKSATEVKMTDLETIAKKLGEEVTKRIAKEWGAKNE